MYNNYVHIQVYLGFVFGLKVHDDVQCMYTCMCVFILFVYSVVCIKNSFLFKNNFVFEIFARLSYIYIIPHQMIFWSSKLIQLLANVCIHS